MKAIQTRYLGCTNTKGSRIKAWAEGGHSVTIGYIFSLILDAGVIGHANFEDWASEFGYDTDSRKAEKIYRDCLATALKLRNGLSEKVLAELQDASQEY